MDLLQRCPDSIDERTVRLALYPTEEVISGVNYSVRWATTILAGLAVVVS
jgi:hypothetical protein